MRRVWRLWAPPPNLSTTEWADRYRYLSAKASARPGKYDSSLTPYIPGIHEALDDPKTYKVVCQKSAQVAWTDGVVNNYVGRRIDIDPAPIIIMFPKEGAAKEYSQEKFAPMVEVTPRLADKVDISKSRASENRALFKNFAGGFLKMVGSNSTASVKSTPAPVVIIEEPDDANVNVKGQGDSIKLLEERAKTFHRRKIAMGGTPSISGLSTIEDAYNNSDKRRFFVPCHECGESHVLDWDHVRWREDKTRRHEIYGHALTETACYACPHCGCEWDDIHKNRNVQNGQWRATAEFRGVAGFHISELYSPFPGSVLARLVERRLEAKKKAAAGDDTDLIVFTNSALGLAYEYQSDTPDADELQTRAEDYPELVVPHGGLLLTAGVDVQHDRFAIVIRAWGRGDESWLVYWGEIYGAVNDRSDPVWAELDKRLFSPIPHAGGGELHMSAISIDSGDGKTNDAVYDWVRKHRRRGVMAIKGASEGADKEIFSTPRASIDHKSPTKAARYGLRVYIVGTDKAKDLITGRIQLDGQGPGRFHYYREVRADYFDQITSEVKAPSRRYRGRKIWQLRAGQRNEALDAEVYALHAARAKKTHTMGPAQWDALEASLRQGDLLSAGQDSAPQAPPPTSQPAPRRRDPGLGSDDWAL